MILKYNGAPSCRRGFLYRDMLTIRTATIADAGLIADMSRQTFYETFSGENTKEDMDKFMNEQFSREKLVAEVGEPGNVFFLVYDGDLVAGYAKMREGEERPEFGGKTAIEIARIYASAAFIGKGAGSKLMQHCIDKARELGGDIIWLGVWEKNERAILFYNRWGFKKFGTHDFVLGNDVQTDWLMAREVQ